MESVSTKKVNKEQCSPFEQRGKLMKDYHIVADRYYDSPNEQDYQKMCKIQKEIKKLSVC
jgi:hypothetical protein